MDVILVCTKQKKVKSQTPGRCWLLLLSTKEPVIKQVVYEGLGRKWSLQEQDMKYLPLFLLESSGMLSQSKENRGTLQTTEHSFCKIGRKMYLPFPT